MSGLFARTARMMTMAWILVGRQGLALEQRVLLAAAVRRRLVVARGGRLVVVVVLEAHRLLVAFARVVLAGRLAGRLGAQPVEQNRAERLRALLDRVVRSVGLRRAGARAAARVDADRRLGRDARRLARTRAARAPDPRILLVVEEHEREEDDRQAGQREAHGQHPERVPDGFLIQRPLRAHEPYMFSTVVEYNCILYS